MTEQEINSQKVLLAYVRGVSVSGAFHESMIQLIGRDARVNQLIQSVFAIQSGPNISASRNNIVRNFLDGSKYPWLWMIDTDMTFQPNILDKMVEVADPKTRPILGALCFAKGDSGQVVPTLYNLPDPNSRFVALENYPRNQLIKVDGTGMACILMHRSALETMRFNNPYPFEWFEETNRNGVETSEDKTFCIRAQEAGFPIYVDTSIKCGHEKTLILDEELFDSQQIPVSSLVVAR